MNEWSDAESRVERAHELYDQGRWVEAAAELRAAIEVNPDNASWYFNLGMTLEAMEEYAPAVRAFKASLRLEPDDLETLNCLAVNLTRLGRFAESLKCYARIDRLDPSFEPSYCSRIITFTEMGRHEDAELMFYLARQITAECPACNFNIGDSFYLRGQYDRAIGCWKETLRLEPGRLQVNARIADAYWAKGMLDEALERYRAEMEFDGGDIETVLDAVELLMEMGRMEQAQGMLQKALAGHPDHAPANFYLGQIALMRNDLDLAEAQFAAVARLEPAFPGVRMNMARVMIGRSNMRQAVRLLRAEIRRHCDDPHILHQAGQLLLQAGRLKLANEALSRLVTLMPQDPQAQHDLAVSYFRLRKVDHGIRHCRKAIKLKPDYALALYNLAVAHRRLGQIRRARRYASRALLLAPRDKDICKLARNLRMPGLLLRLGGKFQPDKVISDLPN
ncbi:MAG: tetratricopeptide repeat protein [Planctomycetes bacterium]|nr:tetratricopeptide repeat protein [Planctomycetota bacterium]